MKSLLYSLLIMLFTSLAHSAEKTAFSVQRGTNISHWLSQSDRRGAERVAWFTKSDVAFLANLGFDHLRLPIDEEQMWDAAGKPEPEAFALLNQALDWCAEYKLNAIVDLHILRSHHFNEKERPLWTQPAAQERFYQCWRELSDALHTRPLTQVAYELMNEPVADQDEDWNKILALAVAAVRQLEPERVLVIGSNRWQSTDTFPNLSVPAGDPNILLSFHFYEPFLLTHHTASWTPIAGYASPVVYPGQTVTESDIAAIPEPLKDEINTMNGIWTREKIAEKMSKPLAVAKSLGLPLYCGEWGCLDTVPRDSRLQWYRDMVSVLGENGIGWTTWDYQGSFGLRKPGQPADEDLVNILISK